MENEILRGDGNSGVYVQWFPGHMAKTRRMIKDSLPLVDAVVEVKDARIPRSSENPELNKIIGSKPRIIILNKSDYADPNMTGRWVQWYKKQGITAIAADCRSGSGLDKFIPAAKETLKSVIAKYEAKGMKGRALRLMVVGIPNVGKSSFINRMANRKKARVEDRPGVTMNKQWVRLDKDVELLDMPGVLWPKFDDMSVGEKLAFTGAVKDVTLDAEALAGRLLKILCENYGGIISERYKIEDVGEADGGKLLEAAAAGRKMLMRGGEPDTERAAAAVLDEYRSGKMGRITLESV